MDLVVHCQDEHIACGFCMEDFSDDEEQLEIVRGHTLYHC